MVKRRRPFGPKHLVIPDTQIKPGADLSHIEWAARYAADKKPDVICQIGDWHDMPSLSAYDYGKRASHGRRVFDDIQVGNDAIALFEKALARHSPKSYKPLKFVTLGNHDGGRIDRAVEEDPKLHGTLSTEMFAWKKYGWKVYPFLVPATVHNITYAHFFPRGPNGTINQNKNGAPTAKAQCQREMRTCTSGHKQGLDIAIVPMATGTYRGLIAGSYYPHEEAYLTPQGTQYWRGIALCHDIQPKTGFYDLCEVSLGFLRRKYG